MGRTVDDPEESTTVDLTAPPAPSPRTAPNPRVAPSPSLAPSPARYVYLVGRLRGRQITMEEATELFEIQNVMIARATAPPPGPRRTPTGAAATAPAGGGTNSILSEDMLWESLPPLAAALGIFAAIMKRAQSPDPNFAGRDPPRPSTTR